MKIGVFGLGYVGTVSSACLATAGHEVVVVEPTPQKVELVNSGRSPIVERDLEQLIRQGVRDGHLRATGEVWEAVAAAELLLVCVGTPSTKGGAVDLHYVTQVSQQIGEALREKEGFLAVVLRSTVPPGSTRHVVIPTVERASGKSAGYDFGVAFNPEFMREGSAVADYQNPPKIVVGGTDERTFGLLQEIYSELPKQVMRTELDVAEMLKYVDNTWHALKVNFANEIGALCKPLDIDSYAVMGLFCADKVLNISTKYLRPGFAFGGSCLPKDVRALNYKAKELDLRLPLIESILPSNSLQLERVLETILGFGLRRIGVLGLSFKAGTDDLRESPVVALLERLIGKGLNLKIFDGNVALSQLLGANRDYIHRIIPHIASLMVAEVKDVFTDTDLIVVANGDPGFSEAINRFHSNQIIIDLVRIGAGESEKRDWYHGLSW
jgi:GDP-mannose 6-dehydrogenase